MNLQLVHFENATPALADMGLEHVLGPLMRAVFFGDSDDLKAILTPEEIGKVFKGLADGGKAHALRRLIVAITTPGPDLHAAEADKSKMDQLLKDAALRPVSEVWGEFIGFFSSCGLSLTDFLDSSSEGKTEAEVASSGSAEGPTPAP